TKILFLFYFQLFFVDFFLLPKLFPSLKSFTFALNELSMEISGRIKKMFETQSFASGFKKRELVITTQEQYPQDILIEFTQDKIDLLNAVETGDEVKISIN